MMNEVELRKTLPDQSSGSGQTFGTSRHPSVIDPILSKRVCFYKSGDPQFSGLRLVINNRTFKTFDALLDSLSKKVPLPFGVRNITTPRGIHAINSLDELKDGKSYICSDSRKVKPINLALARKKLPPWYHARPVSSRRRTIQQGRFLQGQSIHKQESVLIRTPKSLLVFRNGDPTVKHTVVLQKKTTPTYEAILEYISELMRFHVVKLHTPDGRRVDGVPGLILCSGTVVAVGREPFRPADYNSQKSPSPTWLRTKQMSFKRQKASNRKKKSRNFSSSSESYIVRQIHNTIAESSCDIHSNPTNSVELESKRILESVAETDGDGAEGQDYMLPSDDNIEKSFQVNQDGSMTVEMKVRLTIKEEESIHWTTTVTRSSVNSQLNGTSLPESKGEQDICSPESNSLDLQSPAAIVDTINKDKTKDNNDDDPPSLGNGALSESSNEEENIKKQSDVVSSGRAPTPGYKQIGKKQASVESIKAVTEEGIQQEIVGSYSYREPTGNGTMTEQYCMVKQSSTRPVPKPRRLSSLDVNSKNVSGFKSTEMSEILQIESSGEEVTETIIHIYEQQTCQDNFFANVCTHPATTVGRPATSETGQLSQNNELECYRPSTASESISIWKTESMSMKSQKNGAVQGKNRQQQLQKPRKDLHQRETGMDKRTSSKPRAVNKHVQRLATPRKRQKQNTAEATRTHKKAKTFSSAGFIRRIYGNKMKSSKRVKILKKRPTQNGERRVATKKSEVSDDTTRSTVKDSNVQSVLKKSTERVSFDTSRMSVSPNEVHQARRILTRQTSMHVEKRSENESYDITGSVLPAFNSSSTVTNEYVESWLQKAHLNPPSHSHDEHQKLEASTVAQTENGRCEEPENKHSLIAVEEDVKCSEIKTCQTSDPPPPPEGLLATSVKLRVQSFENKSSPSLENTRARHQIVHHHHTTTKNTENWKNESQKEEINPPVPPSDKTSTETQLDSEAKNKSSSIRISFQKATPLNTFSMELPPPPPPAENTELSDTEYCMNDASSAVSSPLYRLSSVSSEGTDNNPLSISPTSGKAVSFRVNATAPPSRTPSIKRAPLVSNRSLERKMSLRKACVDKYALSSEAAPEETTLSTHTVGSDAVCSTERQQSIEAQTEEAHQSGQMSCPSCGTSASPTSLTSEEGLSLPSISSNDASVPSNIPFKERGMTKATQKEASTPKVLVKKAKVKTSPFPERKLQNQKSQDGSVQLSTEQRRPEDKTLSPKTGIQKHAASNGSPSAEKKQINEPKQQKRHSPYSQSLDMVSPPVKHKSSRKLLSRDLSSDNPSEPATKRHKKTSVQRKSHQTPESVKSKSERDKPLTSDTFLSLETDQSIEKKKAEGEAADQETSMTDMQIIKPSTTANQPSMKPVLEKICYSIKSIRQMTQNKRPSCLEKSNSLPDFSSHVASTFGSSSRTLLAFLSVMTLKEGITNLNRDELNANNVSCAEALKMIDSLREIASIEDSHRLHRSLSNLQKSASKQLLQSWKGFQELSDRCKSRSSTLSASEPELITEVNPEEEHIVEENIIDELMDNLDVPEKLKEELASLSVTANTECDIKELWPKESSDESTRNFSKEDAATVPDATQDDKADVEVRSSIIKVTDISQMQQSGEDRSYLITEEAKDNPIVQATKDNDPPVDSHSKLATEERQLHSKASFAQEYKVDLHSCQGASAENIIEGEVTSEKNLENESGSDDEGQKMSSASKELAEKESCKQSVPSSEAGEQRSSEENESEAECEEMRQGSSETEDLSNPENHSEEEDGKLASPSYYVELNVREAKSISSLDSENQTEVKCTEMSKVGLSTPVCLSSSEKEQQSQTYSMGLNISAEESTGNSDMDKSSSEEEQPEAECKKLQVIAEESFSCIEEEEEDMEEKQLHDLPDDRKQKKTASSLLSALTEEPNEDKVSSEDEDSYIEETYICDGTKSESRQSNLIENQVSEKDSLIGDRSNTDDDSGNDHNSYEEHVEEEQTKAEDEQISSSTEELSYYEKQPSSEEEQAHVDRYKGESRIAHQEAPAVATQSRATNSETSAAMLQHQSEEIMPQSVAERVILLEKRVADAEKRKSTTKSSAVRCYPQRKAHLDSDDEDSPCESLALCTRSAPQSSLSFSYDSSGVVTTEPEGSRVRSIREMFLAKSATDIQQTRFPSPRTSELELRAETSVSGGYQSQTSSEMSSGEDDLSKKSITKGFVRRTIERLYGKKDSNPDEEAGERPPFEPKQEKNGQSSIFAPFHTARSKAMSELSYFYSANALDTLSEATRCIAFNAQVGPGDSIPIDDGRWLLRDNTFIRKSVSDPIGINKTFTNTPEGKGVCEDTEDKTPYSLFATKPEPEEDKTKLFSRKCTYFSLPHASESDTCQDELSTASRNSANGDSIVEAKDNSEDTKTWAERNGMLPTMTDFKMMDNKVHPVIEPPPEDEVVVVQPGKGQGVVNRRLPEQDILDVLYNFCGQHCPLL
ncbi:oxygen-regulated protein 1-like [Archocentrus centrarchus]|uniref:oxygen-regulated protein 1-like n=1 Tax=Archocentrus centrarchus TaxID=63155 RepID=UPI0011EA298D|nr:oxygen-regulated protein 1-like [Archocentrus centrarchus]